MCSFPGISSLSAQTLSRKCPQLTAPWSPALQLNARHPEIVPRPSLCPVCLGSARVTTLPQSAWIRGDSLMMPYT